MTWYCPLCGSNLEIDDLQSLACFRIDCPQCNQDRITINPWRGNCRLCSIQDKIECLGVPRARYTYDDYFTDLKASIICGIILAILIWLLS